VAPASRVTAANSKANARVIFAPCENRLGRETGHNWRDFASDEPVSAADFQTLRLKRHSRPGDGSNVREPFDETR
jgi:hypothetical protein